jgi:hypothetical protein
MREFHAECVKILRARPLRRAGDSIFTAVLQKNCLAPVVLGKFQDMKLTVGAI